MPGEAVRDALGAAGGTLAMLTPHPAGVMPCLGEGEERGGERRPLPPPQPVGMRALGRPPRVPGPAPAPACGPAAPL